jgi:hypothetical protein
MMGLDPAVFVPAVVSVGQSGVMGVRIMAAAALAPLVPAEQLQAVCLQLADTMAAAAAQAANTQQQQQASQGVLTVSQNGLHGTLLQLTALLSATSNSSSDQASNASSCTAAAALVQQLLPAFVQSSSMLAPLGSSSSMCCAVRQAYVAAAGQLLVLAYKHWPRVVGDQAAAAASTPGSSSSSSSSSSCQAQMQCLVSALQSSCLAAIQRTVPAATPTADAAPNSSRDQQEPLYSCWLRDCTALLLGPLLQLQLQLLLQRHSLLAAVKQQGSSSSINNSSSSSSADAEVFACQVQQLAQLVPVALQSSVYEVRAAALKACTIQLQRLLAVCHMLQTAGHDPFTATSAGCHTRGNETITTTTVITSSSSSSSGNSGSAVAALAGVVWAALQQQQVTKVTKRLLETWGLLQQLQQLTPQGMQHVGALGGDTTATRDPSNAGVGASAAAAAAPPPRCLDCDQLLVLSGLSGRCREPEAAAQRLLCQARVVRNIILLDQYPHTAADVSSTAGPSTAAGCQLDAQQLMLVREVCDTIDLYSEPRQPEQLREAAAAALQLSALLLPLVQVASLPAAAGRSAAAEAPGSATPQQQQQQRVQEEPSVPCDNGVADVSARAWFLALRLMEDEEEDVRLASAAAAQQALQLLPAALLQPLLPTYTTNSDNTTNSGASSSGSRTQKVGAALGPAAAGVPVGRQYVAVLQYSCFAMLGRCGSWQPGVLPQLVQQLLRVAFPADTAVPQVLLRQQQAMGNAASMSAQSLDTAAASAGTEPPPPPPPPAAAAAEGGAASGAGAGQCDSDVVLRLPGVALRRLFEREADNHHEEPLLLAQHAVAALRQALSQQQQQQQQQQQEQSGELCGVLSNWCSSATCGFLSGVVDGLSQAAAGRVGCSDLAATALADVAHPEVYVPLYRCCLGMWALGQWLQQQQQQQQQQQRRRLLGELLGLRLPAGLHHAAQAALEGWGLDCPDMRPALFLL